MKKEQFTEQEIRMADYQMRILDALNDVLFDETSDRYIGGEELSEGDNATEFIHVLATAAPNYVYRAITGHDVDNLQFNHIANTLCFQYMSVTDEE